MTVQSRPKDWSEDFSHENGNYNCICCTCGAYFIGHKRRVTCKECATKDPMTVAQAALVPEVAALIEAAKAFDLLSRNETQVTTEDADAAIEKLFSDLRAALAAITEANP